MSESHCNMMLNHELQTLHGAVVMKHTERVTLGWPDSQVVWRGFSSFLELKQPRRVTELVTSMFRPLQLETLKALEVASQKRSWVIAFRDGANKSTEIYQPSMLSDEYCPQPYAIERAVTGFQIAQYLVETGAIKLKGFRYDAVRALIGATHSADWPSWTR